MIRINYIKENGQRSSVSFTDSDIRAIEFLTNGKEKRKIDEYIYSKIGLANERKNSFSSFIRECIISDLMNIAERVKDE